MNEINASVSLLDLVQSAGVKLTREGPVWTGDCPFHDDKNGALLVDPSKGHWQCDGACQTGGDIVAWVMRQQSITREQALAYLVQHYGGVLKSESSSELGYQADALLPQFSAESDDQQVLLQTVDFYNHSLKTYKPAQKYLKKRCIDHPDVISHFRLGFSDRSLGTQLPLKNRKEGAAIRGKLQRLGILKSSGHELFRGSITVPVIKDGQLSQIYGRKITPNLRAGTPQHVLLPGRDPVLFNMEAVEVSKELIVAKSIVDALTFWCAGYRNVTCAVGDGMFTDDHLKILIPYAPKRVLIAFDATPEGDMSTQSLANQLNDAGIDAYRIKLPTGLDVNALAMKSASPKEALGDAIRQASWLGKGQPLIVFPEEIPDAQEVEPDIEPDVEEECQPIIEEPEVVLPEPEPEIASTDQAELSEQLLPATVAPRLPEELEVEIRDNELVIQFEQRRYRIRGFEKNLSYDLLKLNILVSQGEGLHVDTFDLYATKPRASFIRQSAVELGVKEELIKKDLAQILLKLEILQEENIRQVLKPKAVQKELNEKERSEALSLLESPDITQRILDDCKQCGLVGEETNKLVAYLAALSRKLDKPLAIMVQSTSAAGKSALMDAVLSFMPEEECVQYSAITGQSLFYMGNVNLKHKVLAISEEEGASNASYALKLLQSEGHLTIASTGKDPVSGRHTTHEYRVDGPVMIFSTTTAIDIDEELLNRCLVLTVNEDQAQTEAIHQWQRYEETLEGLLANHAREDILRIHRNAQRLIRPLRVVNPYATQLTFLSDKTRTRRDHRKYLTLIRSIALLHQYQREVKTTYYGNQEIEYIEVTFDDIALANRIAHEVLGRSLDELPPQTRHLLTLINQMVTERCSSSLSSRRRFRFSRRDIREYTRWGLTQLKVHLQRLEAMEYLLIHQGGRGRQRVYELLYNSEGKDGSNFLMGLMDVDILKQAVSDAELSESGRSQVGGKSDWCHSGKSSRKSSNHNRLQTSDVNTVESTSNPIIPALDRSVISNTTMCER